MAIDFDQFPINDPLIKADTTKMSPIWQDFMSTFYMNLISYLSQFGVFVPNMTTVQRDSIQSPQEGQMIYNTDATAGPPRTGEVQVWQVKADVGAWRTVTTTP